MKAHGGGAIGGSEALSAPEAAYLSETLGVVVVNVEYRLAPEATS
jgi:acetyl esterase/lipase